MGCSEIINQRIVEDAGFGDYAQSCLRSNAGNTCGQCWKCFRKNSLKGRKITISKEIDTFLKQEKLKMAASTIFSIQRMQTLDNTLYRELMKNYQNLETLVNEDVNFLEHYYTPALSLIPEQYRNYVEARLKHYQLKFGDENTLEKFQLYD